MKNNDDLSSLLNNDDLYFLIYKHILFGENVYEYT